LTPQSQLPSPLVDGATGARGYTGSKGDTGIGYAGSRGQIGFTGSRGDTAYIGSRGATGVAGPTGGAGPVGSRGFTGSKGDIGATGIGPTGSRGAIGPVGDKGYTGSKGAGFTGSVGVGFSGSRGFTGSGGMGYTGSVGAGYTGSKATFSRTSASATTGTLADGASSNITAVGFKGYFLYKIETTVEAWVRIYASAAARDADSSRLIDVDPTFDAGVIAEVRTGGPGTFPLVVNLAPPVAGYNNDTSPTTNIYMRVTNLVGFSSQVGVTLTLLQNEN